MAEETVPMKLVKLSAAEKTEAAEQLAELQDQLEKHELKAKDVKSKLGAKSKEIKAEISELAKQVRTGTREEPAQEELPGIEKPKKKGGRIKLVDENPTGVDPDDDPDMKN